MGYVTANTTEQVDVSVVIPCYNHGSYIEEAIESVLAYNGQYNVEIIIVNDGSTETKTLEVINSLEKKGFFVINKANKGLGAARNSGISVAKGEFILPLDSDNKIRPDYIEKSVSIFRTQPTVGVVHGDAMRFGEETHRWEVGKLDIPRLFRRNYIDACAVYRKQIWQDLGGYDEKMPFMGLEDWEFWLRIVMHDWTFHYIPEILFDYRVRHNSMVKTETKNNYDSIVEYIFTRSGFKIASALHTESHKTQNLEREFKTYRNQTESHLRYLSSTKGATKNLLRVLRKRIFGG